MVRRLRATVQVPRPSLSEAMKYSGAQKATLTHAVGDTSAKSAAGELDASTLHSCVSHRIDRPFQEWCRLSTSRQKKSSTRVHVCESGLDWVGVSRGSRDTCRLEDEDLWGRQSAECYRVRFPWEIYASGQHRSEGAEGRGRRWQAECRTSRGSRVPHWKRTDRIRSTCIFWEETSEGLH